MFWGCIVLLQCKSDFHPYFTEVNTAVLLAGRLLLSKGMNPFFPPNLTVLTGVLQRLHTVTQPLLLCGCYINFQNRDAFQNIDFLLLNTFCWLVPPCCASVLPNFPAIVLLSICLTLRFSTACSLYSCSGGPCLSSRRDKGRWELIPYCPPRSSGSLCACHLTSLKIPFFTLNPCLST